MTRAISVENVDSLLAQVTCELNQGQSEQNHPKNVSGFN